MIEQDMKRHPFEDAPNRTFVKLAVPVLFSLVAEPVTGLVDTAFVARLGSGPLAALGIGTMIFSSVFWIFSFLGIGTQTEVGSALGRGDRRHAAQLCFLSMGLGFTLGLLAMLCTYPFLGQIIDLMGGGAVRAHALKYMQWRLLGAPAVLVTLSAFGALRGAQDMRTPLMVATGVNLLNVFLDWLLIFGAGPVPALGVAGAAIASSLSQWIGAGWVALVLYRRIGLSLTFQSRDVKRLFAIGGDLFIRTGGVIAFLMLCTRLANKTGADEGAAYQAIRQFFIFAALFLDAFAITGQSLIAYFMGRADRAQARRVAGFTCVWSFGTGTALCAAMLFGQDLVAWLLVPPAALAVFYPAWVSAALIQPVSSLSYAVDGIHWGTGDFAFLRNAMLVACLCAIPAVFIIEAAQPAQVLPWLWAATGLWTGVRALFGMLRVWPGIGQAPLRK